MFAVRVGDAYVPSSENLDTIHGEDWLDMKIGDKAFVQGKSTRNRQGDTVLCLTQPDWSVIAIDIPDPEGLLNDIPDQTTVTLTAVRTEDGLAIEGVIILHKENLP